MTAPRILDRKTAVPALVGDPTDFLIVSGLAGAAKDTAELTREAPNAYLLGGAMGGGVPMAFGLALAQPKRRVLAIVGDADLLMFLGALATVAVVQPPNLAILVVDNGHCGETGYQEWHTNTVVDLEMVAKGCGIATTHTVSAEADIAAAARSLRHANGTAFVWLRTSTAEPPKYHRNFDAVDRKNTFRRALLGEA